MTTLEQIEEHLEEIEEKIDNLQGIIIILNEKVLDNL